MGCDQYARSDGKGSNVFMKIIDARVKFLQAVPQCLSMLIQNLVSVTRQNFKLPCFLDQRHVVKILRCDQENGNRDIFHAEVSL